MFPADVRLFVLPAALIAMSEGYDLSVYGVTVPALLHEPGWNLSTGEAGDIGSLVAVGMLIGAAAVGATAAIAVPARPAGRPTPRRTTAPVGTAESAAGG